MKNSLMKVKIIQKDKVSALNEAERKGVERGIKEGEKNKAVAIAKSMKLKGMDSSTIKEITGIDIDSI